MKKIKKTLFAFTFTSLFFVSCGGKSGAYSINVAELKTACDFVNASEKIVDELISIKGDKKSPSELSEADKENGRELMKKWNEIEKSMKEKNFPEADLEKCEGSKRLIEKTKKAFN
jgi:hypothetical protein